MENAGRTWQDAVREKQIELASHIPEDWKLDEAVLTGVSAPSNIVDLIASTLSPSELQITNLSVPDLLAALQTGDLTAIEVLSAFSHRAVGAHQCTRCLSEINFPAARQRALDLDAFRRLHRSTRGPLHGLPVSLMDRFHVAGLDSACGFASWIGTRRTKEDEGVLVQKLHDLGAVIFCKSSVPMSMMMGETTNNIIGTTTNPRNRNLSAGGACGGEGALIALRGSPIGFGTDVAGSCRIPSAFNGLWALKVSERRLPYTGVATVLSGLPISGGTIGLIAADFASLTHVFRELLNSQPWVADNEVLELPWRQDKFDGIHRRKQHAGRANGRLCFGIMTTDHFVNPHPPIARALTLVTEALRSCGYETMEWQPPLHGPAVENLLQIFGSTCAIEARGAINASGEPPVPQIKEWYNQNVTDQTTTAEFWGLCDQQTRFRTQYSKYWESTGNSTSSGRTPDAVILPVAATTAVRPGSFHYFGYSAIANVLDLPAGTFPVTTGHSTLDSGLPRPTTYLSSLDKKVQNTFNVADVDGMPVNLQVICPRLQEEQLLGCMEAILEAIASTAAENTNQR